jgi:tetratricopeptide (TPR) repeat protein
MHHWGRSYFAHGEYAEALKHFRAAYARFPAPALLVNIGQCLRKLDRLDEAAQAFNGFLAIKGGDPRVRTEVFEALDAVLAELDRRLFSLAVSAAQFKKYLESGEGTPELRAAVSYTRKELLEELVRIDGLLTKQLNLPPPAPVAKPGPSTAGRWRMLLRTTAL